MKTWLNLDHQIWTQIKKSNLSGSKFRLCVSGGIDSMVMLESFRNLLKPTQLEIFHFHHGDSTNQSFRDQAAALVKSFAENYKLKFIFEKAAGPLESEKAMRQARLHVLKLWHEREPAICVWGHHQQDLLETRLIRLIRGTGAPGLKSMSIWRAPHFRPLLRVSKTAILEYAELRKVKYLDDPSNQSPGFLRNWVRQNWLPALEKRKPGGVARLGQSLEHLSQNIESQNSSSEALGLTDEGLDRRVYLQLTESEQGRALALLFFHSQVRDFRASQIKEIQKRLDKGENALKFRIAGVTFNVNAERIWISL